MLPRRTRSSRATPPPRTRKPVRDDGIDAWYLTAIHIHTGKTAWSRLTDTGIQWNNHYAASYLGPDGTAYIATLAGLVRIEDGTP